MAKTALLSAYNKDGIADFARALSELGWDILASSGTADFLRKEGIEAKDISEIVGEPARHGKPGIAGGPILGHRVVTLSRKIHAALLSRKDDEEELARLGVPRIDLVYVDLYPLREEISKDDSTEASVIERTDIGGPALLRSASKGRRIVICDTKDTKRVVEWIKTGRPDDRSILQKLAAKAEMIAARYSLTSAQYNSGGDIDGFIGIKSKSSAYGENPWQASAGFFSVDTNDALALENFKQVAGTNASYNNFCDLDRLLQAATHIAAGFDKNFGRVPFIALGVKHGNACGAAVGDDKREVLQKMIEGDTRAIFGGLVMANFEIDEELAEVLLAHKIQNGRRLLDGIIAPSFGERAIDLLKRKGDKCRFFENSALLNLNMASLDSNDRFRYVRGGFLRQQNYNFVLNLRDENIELVGEINEGQEKDFLLAWAIGSTSNSNTVTLVRGGQLVGNGVGQQDRVGCCELAVKKAEDAGHNMEGAVAYSDSFFPFVDGVKVLAKAGVKAILASSGSVRDEEVKKFCENNGLTYCFIPDNIIRGFFGH